MNQNSREICELDRDRQCLVSQSMENLIKLMNNVHVFLEECAIQWQSIISQQQWKILNTNLTTRRAWSHPILLRTYFVNSQLDEAFETLLQCEKVFLKHVHNFVAAFQNEMSMRRQTIENPTNSGLSDQRRTPKSSLTRIAGSSTENSQSSESRMKFFINDNLKDMFNNLMEAKKNFDTKFLSFNVELQSDDLQSPKCVCAICANKMKTKPQRKKTARKGVLPQSQRIKRNVRRRNKSIFHKPSESRMLTRNQKRSASIHESMKTLDTYETYKE